MRALEYSEARKFSIVDKALPTIREHDVLIKVKASGVCRTDLHIHDGEFRAQFPLVPGHETVGQVAAFGSQVEGFKVGDRVVADNSELCKHCYYCWRGRALFCDNFIAHGVMVDGEFAEYAAYPAYRVFQFKNLSDVDATLFRTCRIVCAVVRCGADGANPRSAASSEWWMSNGDCCVTGLKRELAKSLGAADEFVEPSREARAAVDEMEKLRAGHPYGFDIVVEATGSDKILEDAINFCHQGRKAGCIWGYGDEDFVSLSPNKIFKEGTNVMAPLVRLISFRRLLIILPFRHSTPGDRVYYTTIHATPSVVKNAVEERPQPRKRLVLPRKKESKQALKAFTAPNSPGSPPDPRRGQARKPGPVALVGFDRVSHNEFQEIAM
ncbi:hypothetical protein N7532_009154 [Penicillium argentinense]|uniref:Alcohol dehydrogenase-like N-terminal domain-containing protein n=1 Tax=Penicillium argentinense TaxID=1131581 RepID=A0A9W9EYY0_9EURO|nr:uncharacterized protein N7532_009154 [Penicillium argentinense]KAJ5090470.1 hypothetical protein N7532_009154 [Penicillium argentinense]